MSETDNSIVIGAGIVGLCTALYLQERGLRVLLLDRQPPGEGTSSGNAGIISVDSAQPEAMPGIWKDIPSMVLGKVAPVSLRPAYLPQFLPWFARFLANSSEARAETSSIAIHALSAPALSYLQALVRKAGAEDLLKENGLLYVYETEAEFARARAKCAFYDRRGVDYQLLDGAALLALEPSLRKDLAGGIFIDSAGHTTSPLDLSRALFALFKKQGGRFEQSEVTGFSATGGSVESVQTKESIACRDVFVTAGSWSHLLARQLGSDVPLDTERGYHQRLPDPGVKLSRSILFPSRGFAATSMRGGLRLAGTVEFAGLNAAPDYRRATVLADQAERLFPGLNREGGESWMGYRPSLPDSVPVISGSPHFKNVYFGFGHGHLGLTQSAVTGACLAAMATGDRPPVDLSHYRIDRRF